MQGDYFLSGQPTNSLNLCCGERSRGLCVNGHNAVYIKQIMAKLKGLTESEM